MKVRALRGVCIGVGRNLATGEVAEIHSANANDLRFLILSGAVEEYVELAPEAPTQNQIVSDDGGKGRRGKD